MRTAAPWHESHIRNYRMSSSFRLRDAKCVSADIADCHLTFLFWYFGRNAGNDPRFLIPKAGTALIPKTCIRRVFHFASRVALRST
jgi:hypothetical protein